MRKRYHIVSFQKVALREYIQSIFSTAEYIQICLRGLLDRTQKKTLCIFVTVLTACHQCLASDVVKCLNGIETADVSDRLFNLK